MHPYVSTRTPRRRRLAAAVCLINATAAEGSITPDARFGVAVNAGLAHLSHPTLQ